MHRARSSASAEPRVAKFDGKVTHRPWKKAVDIGGNPDHITLGLGLQ